jgi:Tol biopolymer transport system component
VRKCLEKDRGRRYQTMKDVALDLESLAQEMSDAKAVALAASTEVPALRRRTHRTVWIAGFATLALAAAAAIYIWASSSTSMTQRGYEAITDFTDAATAPALSPDGRMVTFIRGGSWFVTRTGQIYVKMLPNGEAVRLTDDPRAKLGPVFSPDGTRIAYTAISDDESGPSWDTWTVPVSGDTPTRLLANASGLTWIDPRHVLFSEIQPGPTLHMGLVTATEDRREARQLYLPAHERAMAHYSSLSPNRAWVLVVEMGGMGTFESCRLVPFDGSSNGRQVGPAGVCQAAAWSPDGRWMYFAAEVDGPSHLWRQRFPNGTPEPITSGPATEEEGVAIAPDGRSLITSIGIRQSSLWLHSGHDERVLSSEGYASMPRLSADGTRLYYLLRRASGPGMIELRVMDLASQKSERLLPDFSIVDYDVSRDGREIAVTTTAADRSPEIWVASTDRRTAPRRVVQGGDNVGFAANRDLVFRSVEGHVNSIDRIGSDGQNRVRLSETNAFGLVRVSPDGRWVSVAGGLPGDRVGVIVVPVYGGATKLVCYNGCRLDWSPDAASLYIGIGVQAPSPVLILPLQSGHVFPEFPSDGEEALPAWRKLPSARLVERPESIPGLDQSTYVLTKSDERRNLFRVPLPR